MTSRAWQGDNCHSDSLLAHSGKWPDVDQITDQQPAYSVWQITDDKLQPVMLCQILVLCRYKQHLASWHIDATAAVHCHKIAPCGSAMHCGSAMRCGPAMPCSSAMCYSPARYSLTSCAGLALQPCALPGCLLYDPIGCLLNCLLTASRFAI